MKKIVLGLLALCYGSIANAQSKLYPNEFDLQEVKLSESPFLHARDVNVKVLKEYDVDRLIAPYLRSAGLPAAKSFENWIGLDGHVGGHYLSALAIHYAATGDKELLRRMEYMLNEMKKAQDANKDGYVGGVDKECWELLRKGDVTGVEKRWVPWYNMHKVFAGLRDAYLYTGSRQAIEMFYALCDWGINQIKNLDENSMERMLGTEFGGMDEVYADAYDLSGDKRYLDAAIRFSHKWLLDPMAAGNDMLDNRHANTQVPKVVGYQRIAELCERAGMKEEAKYYKKAADFFWNTVVNTRSLAIGGNSRREHFASASDCISYVEDREGPESCNTNNMLKLTEGLFRMEPKVELADFFERATYNHILSTQHPEHGGYVYFTSARPAHYRVYSQPNEAMWCCVGTGMENHGKYSQFIYTHDGDSILNVNLFIPSEVKWTAKFNFRRGMRPPFPMAGRGFKRPEPINIKQETNFPYEEGTRITIDGDKKFTLNIRKPYWAEGFAIKINGKSETVEINSFGYATITREWKKGDVVEVSLPMGVHIEELPNLPEYIAIMRGPIVLGKKMGTNDLAGLIADDGRWSHIASGSMVPVTETPALIGNKDEILKGLKEMKAIDGKPFHYIYKDMELEPFFGIHDSRYMFYWLTMTQEQWTARQDEIKKKEAEQLHLDAITVDAVNFGEQQPEVDHQLKSANSERGLYQGQSYRHAENGWFSVVLDTKSKTNLTLRCRYWGNETGNRTFDIFVDGHLLATCNNTTLSGKSEFVEKEYTLPADLLKDKERITIIFKAHEGHYAGGVYHIRLFETGK